MAYMICKKCIQNELRMYAASLAYTFNTFTMWKRLGYSFFHNLNYTELHTEDDISSPVNNCAESASKTLK